MIDLGLNDEQRQMSNGAAGLLQEKSPVSRLRPSGKPNDIQRELAAWGWFGAGLPEARGGLGLGIAGETLLAYEAGRFLLSPSVLATTFAAHLCAEDRLDGLLAGETRAALVLADGGAALVFDRREASMLVVFEADRVWLAPAEAFGGASVIGFDETLAVERGVVDAGASLGAEAAAHGRLLVSAMLAGSARASCDLAVGHAKAREQFGQPIGAFQAVKHLCADMGLRAYAAEAQVKMAAAAAANTPGAAAFQIDAAALSALRAARDNASDAIQVHGGIGFTAECEAHFHLKRAHLLGRVLGGPEACRARVLAHAPEKTA